MPKSSTVSYWQWYQCQSSQQCHSDCLRLPRADKSKQLFSYLLWPITLWKHSVLACSCWLWTPWRRLTYRPGTSSYKPSLWRTSTWLGSCIFSLRASTAKGCVRSASRRPVDNAGHPSPFRWLRLGDTVWCWSCLHWRWPLSYTSCTYTYS